MTKKAEESKKFQVLFRALKNRNYRLFLGGQAISLTGTWMQQVALSWLVYRLTNSPLLLGLVGFAGQIPAFLVMPIAGVVADRYQRRKTLLLTQSLATVQAFALSILVLTNRIGVWQIILLSAILGLVNGFDMPIRQAFTIEMIDKKEDLGNAIALNSSVFNVARLIGPSIAGILIATVGEGTCFLLNAVSFIPVLISLCAMKIVSQKIEYSKARILDALKEGFLYAFGFSPIRHILLLVSLISLTAASYYVLMPVFARDVFHGGPQTLGFFMAMSGIGALAGALYLASRKTVVGLVEKVVFSACIFGVGLILFSLSHVLWLSMAIILIEGLGMMVQMASSNTILQTIVDEDKRGRAMSFFTMAFVGTAPIGSLLAGSLAAKIGAPHTVLLSGILCLGGALLFAKKLPSLVGKIHPIYVKKGVIPEVAQGLQSVAGLEIASKL